MIKVPASASSCICRLILVLDLRYLDFQYDRLTFSNQRALAAWQFSKERQLHPLHRGLDAAQGMAANQHFVHGENQSEHLLLGPTLEFGKSELVVGQQQVLFSRQFDYDRASVWVARPTFGCFCAHISV